MIDKPEYMDEVPLAMPGALPPHEEEPQTEFTVADQRELEDGSVEFLIDSPAEEALENPELTEFDVNLAEHLSEEELTSMATELLGLVEADTQGRKDWTDTYIRGLDVLGLKYEERTEPWDGACGVYSSLLSEAAIRFQAETIMETFPAAGPVKTQIVGAIDQIKQQAAERVRADMNYQLTERMSEYRPEHERLLYNLSLAGSAFKKVYFDPVLKRQAAKFVPAEDVIAPYGASNIETAERITHVLRQTEYEVKKFQADGVYRDVDIGEPTSQQTDVEQKKAELQGESYNATTDDRFQIYEIQTYLYIEADPFKNEDGTAVPYVVSIDKGTSTVLAVRRNWAENDAKKQPLHHFVHYTYVPGFGFYGFGLIHIIGGYARAGTLLIRQLVDAGTLSNLPGGLKARGLRIKGEDDPIGPGEWRDVDVSSGKIQDNVMPLPYKEPSVVLHALLKDITEEGRKLGAISDMDISDLSSQAPVGTTLALLERTLKPMSAVQARVHYAMKQEFKLLAGIIRDRMPAEYEYVPENGTPGNRASDYRMVEVIPVSDPNSSTMAQRVVQYQAALELAKGAPQLYNLPLLHRQMLDVLGIKNSAKLVPLPDDQTPKDPISENMAFLTGQPTKAFIYQDHQAHITAHMVFLQDPMIAATIGQNPMAQQMSATANAHIAEHLGFLYRRQIEERLGVPLPPPGQPLPEDVETQLAQLVAQAGQQLLQLHQSQAAQQQAQQQAQDPLFQLQQAELQLKAQDLQRKIKKDQDEADLKELKIAVDAQRTGVMGRAQELELQAQDRDRAAATFREFLKLIASNKAGSSGQPPNKPEGQ